jgi:hypothetical protein
MFKALLASALVVSFMSAPVFAKMALPEACKTDCEGMNPKKCMHKEGISEECKTALHDAHKGHGKKMMDEGKSKMEEGAKKMEEGAAETTK